MKDPSNDVMNLMVAPPGGSTKMEKLEKIVEKYAKNMEVHISKLPDKV